MLQFRPVLLPPQRETDEKLAQVQEHLAAQLEQQRQEVASTVAAAGEETSEVLANQRAVTDAAVRSVESQLQAVRQAADEGRAEADGKLEELQAGLAEIGGKLEAVRQAAEEGRAEADGKLEELTMGLADADGKLGVLQTGLTETDEKLDGMRTGLKEAVGKVEGLRVQVEQAQAAMTQQLDERTTQLQLVSAYIPAPTPIPT